MKNQNFNQLTKTIALSLALAIVSGFGNDSINAQTPTSPTVQITSQSCPTQNVDLNQLKTTLNERYEIFNDSLPGLFTSLNNPYIKLETIKTQDQITKLGSIYQCVLEAQDNSNLGAREERIAIRQTIIDISAILTPAKNGFTEETRTTLKTNLKIDDSNLETDDDKIFNLINEIEKNLNNLNTQLNSQIQELGISPRPSTDVLKTTNPDEDSSSAIFGALIILLGIAVGGVTYELLLLRNRQRISTDNTKTKDQKQTIPSEIETNSSMNFTLIANQVTDLSQKYQELEAKVESIETHFKEIQQSPLTLKSTISPELSATSIPNEITLSPEVQQILYLYDNRYKDLEKSGIGVSLEPNNFNQRLADFRVAIVLVPSGEYKFLVVDDRYLVPKSGYRITTIIQQTIEGIFECENFYNLSPFKVVQPAIVDRIQDDRWQVNQKGILHFE